MGELGNGSKNYQPEPAQVKGLNDVVSISCGGSTSFALKKDGTIWVWGNNYGDSADSPTGKLGVSLKYNDSSKCVTTPRKVEIINNVKQIYGADNAVYVIKKDGILWSCGYNETGDFGNGSFTSRYTPVHVYGLNDIVDTDGSIGYVAVKKDGTIWSWGENWGGSLDNGKNEYGIYLQPSKVNDLSNTKDVAAGFDHMVAVAEGGSVYTWGDNFDGQLGNGKKGYNEYPLNIGNTKSMITK